ncbi:4807_t:CDS:2 [Ambispora gerdemannii]|uniref:4807_t:CDS:1 n=1 Tax=Ambispora gerdemannii TaxID=144530 RepID=A0A9N8ZJV8_9GLOM|nr:4807_t:CDS:2 [Ambispora gerdemannii]
MTISSLIEENNSFSNITSYSNQTKQLCIFPECDHQLNQAERIICVTAISYATVIMCTSLVFLYYRTFVKDQSWYFPLTWGKRIIRLRPQEAFHIFASSFGLMIILNSTLLLTESYSDIKWALVGSHLPHVVGYSALTLYPIGLVYSLSSIDHNFNHKNTLLLNRHIIDSVGFFLLLGPALTIFPSSWFQGGYIIDGNYNAIYSVLKKYVTILKHRADPGHDWKLHRVRFLSRHLTMVVASITILYISKIILNLTVTFLEGTKRFYILLNAFAIFQGLVFAQFGQLIILYNFFEIQFPPGSNRSIFTQLFLMKNTQTTVISSSRSNLILHQNHNHSYTFYSNNHDHRHHKESRRNSLYGFASLCHSTNPVNPSQIDNINNARNNLENGGSESSLPNSFPLVRVAPSQISEIDLNEIFVREQQR